VQFRATSSFFNKQHCTCINLQITPFFPVLQHGFHCPKTFGIITLAEIFCDAFHSGDEKIHKTTYISHLILNYTKPHHAPWLLS
jgi:hypothetical protein